MSALVRKDCCVLWKQMRIFLVVILFIAVFNGAFGNVFIVVWASMMPFTAMAYDERSKWDQLAAMMPYSVRDIVLSKYVLGWLCMGAAALASLAIQGILTAVHAPMASLDPVGNLLGLCASACVLAITLPIMFRFGVERGRLVMFLMIFLVCGSAGAVSSIAVEIGDGLLHVPALVLAGLFIAALASTAVSLPLSMKMYRKRTY
ncbi:ABC-2 transporter permease [uncultured Dysosmobacter sp.]|uniref:ABC-2 transporter permease n=1 Tax=uncultured Dysosmobacter sp. TaxID=2591384 RepID=UPI0026320C9A|nr:ABC-2 transporter permease [uncultured Dysosmobacter sp.]